MNEWKPIETAPRDRRIIIWTGVEKYCAHWVKNPFTGDEAWLVGNLHTDGENDQLVIENALLWAEAPKNPE